MAELVTLAIVHEHLERRPFVIDLGPANQQLSHHWGTAR